MPVKDGITAAREINEEFLFCCYAHSLLPKASLAEAIDASWCYGLCDWVLFVPDKLFPFLDSLQPFRRDAFYVR